MPCSSVCQWTVVWDELECVPVSPPSSSMAEKHGACLLTLKKGSRLSQPTAWGNFSTSPTWSTRATTGCINFLVGPQEPLLATIKKWIFACFGHVTRHDSFPQTILHEGHLVGWVMPWLAEEMLDGQHQRVDIPAHARNGQNDPLQKRLAEDLHWIIPHVTPPPMTQWVMGLNRTELNWTEPNLCNSLELCTLIVKCTEPPDKSSPNPLPLSSLLPLGGRPTSLFTTTLKKKKKCPFRFLCKYTADQRPCLRYQHFYFMRGVVLKEGFPLIIFQETVQEDKTR